MSWLTRHTAARSPREQRRPAPNQPHSDRTRTPPQAGLPSGRHSPQRPPQPSVDELEEKLGALQQELARASRSGGNGGGSSSGSGNAAGAASPPAPLLGGRAKQQQQQQPPTERARLQASVAAEQAEMRRVAVRLDAEIASWKRTASRLDHELRPLHALSSRQALSHHVAAGARVETARHFSHVETMAEAARWHAEARAFAAEARRVESAQLQP